MKKYLYISFALLAIVFSADNLYACSCISVPGPLKTQVQNAYDDANAIFSGEVIEVKKSPTDEHNLLVTFRVAKSWKGGSTKVITITTGADSAMCGYDFEKGKTYLVYAYGGFSTSNCSRTAVFDKKGDAKYLNKIKGKKKAST